MPVHLKSLMLQLLQNLLVELTQLYLLVREVQHQTEDAQSAERYMQDFFQKVNSLYSRQW